MGQGESQENYQGWTPPEGPATHAFCLCRSIQVIAYGSPGLHYYDHGEESRDWYGTMELAVETVCWPEKSVVLASGADQLSIVVSKRQKKKNKKEGKEIVGKDPSVAYRAFCAKCGTKIFTRLEGEIHFPWGALKTTTLADTKTLGTKVSIHLNCATASWSAKAYLALPSSLGGTTLAKFDWGFNPISLGLIGFASVKEVVLQDPISQAKGLLGNMAFGEYAQLAYNPHGLIMKNPPDADSVEPLVMYPMCGCCKVLSPDEAQQIAEQRHKKAEEARKLREAKEGKKEHDADGAQEGVGDETVGHHHVKFQSKGSNSNHPACHGLVWFVQTSAETCEVRYRMRGLTDTKLYLFCILGGSEWIVRGAAAGKDFTKGGLDLNSLKVEGDNSTLNAEVLVFPSVESYKPEEQPTAEPSFQKEPIGRGFVDLAGPLDAVADAAGQFTANVHTNGTAVEG